MLWHLSLLERYLESSGGTMGCVCGGMCPVLFATRHCEYKLHSEWHRSLTQV